MSKISLQPPASALTGSELLTAVQGGTTKQATASQLRDYISPTSAGATSKVSGSDFTMSSSALTDITGLTFAAAANHLYEIDVLLKVNSSSGNLTVYTSIHFSAAGASCGWVGIGMLHASTKTTIGANALDSAGGTNIANDGTTGTVRMKGWVLTGANAGNITVRIGANNGYATTVYIGSRMTVTLLV